MYIYIYIYIYILKNAFRIHYTLKNALKYIKNKNR